MKNFESRILSPEDVVMVSTEAFDSSDPYDILESNISVVNDLFTEHLAPEEISRCALMSYYVDFYIAQVNNGGFLQFGFNSDWSDEVIEFVRQGLRDMGAVRHQALLEEYMNDLGTLGMEAASAAYINRNKPVYDHFLAIDMRFYALAEVENLVQINAAWLRRQANLRMLSAGELQQEIGRRSAALSDRNERMKSALDAEPSHMKLIRALCHKSAQFLEQVTIGDQTLFHDGTTVRELTAEELSKRASADLQVSWFFITNKGLHVMMETEDKAIMFQFGTMLKIAEIDTSKDEINL
ncbi:DMP19 family protein [Rhizobium sp. TRM96647]|uniref:DMP19 family protein n=1 Tax=unclassified Rhizobium TaxID=2613769 RepID=UPI0021E6F371|nr:MULTISPECIES: DMP19 family protein [unclassified Rhizobium]MCV3738141.1 DMP19 family protein [Rhizobium sp. TRM96647]MCV3759828.1 DMP19 family protein [Rhizobium sp. TRM96650]